MKSPLGACNLRPLFFIFSYFLLFIFYCPVRPALPCPYPALPCPVSNFPFAARDRRRKLHKERAVFFFPFATRDRRRKLHRERPVFFFSFCCQGQEEEVTQGTGSVFFFLLLPGTGGGWVPVAKGHCEVPRGCL